MSTIIAGLFDTIDRAQGEWSAGKWTDFDPVVAPCLVQDASPGPRRRAAGH